MGQSRYFTDSYRYISGSEHTSRGQSILSPSQFSLGVRVPLMGKQSLQTHQKEMRTLALGMLPQYYFDI